MPVALTVIRFVAPAAGMVRASVPEVTVSGPPTALAVKDEYVPAPMAVAPAATTASVSSTLPRDTLLFMWRAMVDLLGVGPTRAPHPAVVRSRSVWKGVAAIHPDGVRRGGLTPATREREREMRAQALHRIAGRRRKGE